MQVSMGRKVCADYARSWGHYAKANAAVRIHVEHDPDTTMARVAADKALFTREFFHTRRDAGCEAALEQRDGLIHKYRHGAQPRDDVFILLHRTGRHLRYRRGDVLLDATELSDRHQLAGEAALIQRIGGIAAEEVVIELVTGAELGAIDGA